MSHSNKVSAWEEAALVEAGGTLDGNQQSDPGEAHGEFHPAEAVSADYEIVHDVLHAVSMRNVVPHDVLDLHQRTSVSM